MHTAAHSHRPSSAAQRGNAFIFVLLGVALFGALAFTISRGMRSQTTSSLSSRDADLAVSDILSYAQKLERGVNKLRQNGVSENDISFENDFITGYNHTPSVDKNKIFSPTGARVNWVKPQAGANNGDPWIFTGETCVASVGTGGAGCSSDTNPNEELLAVLPNVTKVICDKINERLNITTLPVDTGTGYSTAKFQGVFDDGTEIVLGNPHSAACFNRSNAYHFYVVLIDR
jgi:hypothetical protein